MLLLITAVSGEAHAAGEQLRKMISQADSPLTSWVALGWLAGRIGDHDAAFQLFERARQRRENLLIFVHNYTKTLAPSLMEDPRYGALLDQLSLPRGIEGRHPPGAIHPN